MKGGKIFIIVLFVIIVLIIISFFYLYRLTTKENNPPNAVIELNVGMSSKKIINQGDHIFFSARNSSDMDGKIEEYYWDFDDGNSSQDINPIHKYDHPGEYYVTLTVTDNDGNKNTTHIRIIVNSLPIAKINISHEIFQVSGKIPIDDKVQFNSSSSFDKDGSIVDWKWDFGDGNYSSEPNPNHWYKKIGNFKVSLTIIDNNEASATDYVDLEIITRSYRVTWTINQREEVIKSNGYTLEGESTEILENLQQEFLGSVAINLSWVDYQPLLKNNQSKGEDLFQFDILTPDNVSKTHQTTSGNISFNLEYNPIPLTREYDTFTQAEAIIKALEDAELSDTGSGEWYFNVTALECKGGSWIDSQFDRDVGNFWDLKVIFYYYDYEVVEITYDKFT